MPPPGMIHADIHMLPIEQRFEQAVRHHQSGRLDEAEALYREVLREAPGHPHALHLLGVLAHQTGHHAAAEDLIRRALAVVGPHPVFHANLSAVYLALGRLAEAADQAREAIRLKPDHPEAHNNLGVAVRRLGRLGEAEWAFREVLRYNPNHADARSNLGAVLHRLGHLEEALVHLREAVRLAPGNAQVWNDLGGTLLSRGDLDQAAVHLREAVRLRPNFPSAWSNLGLTVRDLHQTGEAEECFREALRLDPDYTIARTNLADNLNMQGRFGEAAAEYREVLRRSPADAAALGGLGRMAAEGYATLTDAEIRVAGELAANQELPFDDRCTLHFALAATFDRAGRFAEAFEHARRANDLRVEQNRRGGVVYDPASYELMVGQLLAAFPPESFARRRDFGSDSEVPIFVVGMMRSGTSLVEQILASHPRVYGAGELSDITKLLASLPGRVGRAGPFLACLPDLDAATSGAMAEEYLRRVRQLAGPAADRVVDKMPTNYLWLGLLAVLFPKARIIHCRRDPADTCLSCYFQNFANPHPYTSDLRHLGHYFRQYEWVMAHWARVLPVPVFELQYEELTASQEEVSRRLVEFCGLPWDDSCLRFSESRRVVRTASSLQVRKPMYGSSVGRWKRYEPFLQPLLEQLRAPSPGPTG